jgi:hypothetical protein
MVSSEAETVGAVKFGFAVTCAAASIFIGVLDGEGDGERFRVGDGEGVINSLFDVLTVTIGPEASSVLPAESFISTQIS